MSNLPDNYNHAAFVAAYEGQDPAASHELRTLGAIAGLLKYFTGSDDSLDEQLHEAASECATAFDPSDEIKLLRAEVDYSAHPEAAAAWLMKAIAARRARAAKRDARIRAKVPA